MALSRVTTLSSLHLIDFDPSKIHCDYKAALEYNRLRKIYMPHLGDLVNENELGQPSKKRTKRNNIRSTDKPSPKLRKKCPKLLTPEPAQHGDIMSIETDFNNKYRSLQQNIFQFCDIETLDDQFRASLCQRLNLLHYPYSQQGRQHSFVSTRQCMGHRRS